MLTVVSVGCYANLAIALTRYSSRTGSNRSRFYSLLTAQCQGSTYRQSYVDLIRTVHSLYSRTRHLLCQDFCQISTQLESDYGTACCVQLAAAFKQISLPCEIVFYDENFSASMIENPLVIENGCLKLPEGPGSGVNINWDNVERYRVDL